MVLTASSILVGLLVAGAVFMFRVVRNYIKFRKMELAIPGPPTLPVLGNMLDFMGVTEDTMMPIIFRMWGHRRELTRMSLLNNLLVMVTDPEHLDVLFKRKDLSNKSRFFYELLQIATGNGLLTLNGPTWKAHRKALQPAFHKDVLDRLVDVFQQEARGFVARVRPNVDEDVIENLRVVASRSFVRTTLSEEIDEELEHQVVDTMRFGGILQRALNERAFQPLWWPEIIFTMTPTGKTVLKGVQMLSDMARNVLSRRREELSKINQDTDFIGSRKTLVDILLTGNIELTDLEVIDEFKTALGAAVETTIATIGYALKMLSIRPDLQERLHAEVMEVFQGTHRDVAHTDLPKLQAMERFVKETLRLFPALPFVAREVQEQTEFCGHMLPAGTTLIINIQGTHRDPLHWPDPLRFDPDRFLPERSQGRHPLAFLPFSTGQRNCIGGMYAMMNIKTLLATTLRTYRIEPVNDGLTDIATFPITFDVASRLIGGVKVRFVHRTAAPS